MPMKSTCMKPTFEIRVLKTTIVRPSSQVDEETKFPLSVFDRIAAPLFAPVLMAFKPPTPSNQTVMDALADILVSYRQLTGRLRIDGKSGSQYIIVDHDSGVPVIETEVCGDLVDYFPLEPSPDLDLLYPDTENLDRTMSIQLNRFACGGLAIAVSADHRVGDGQSMSYFFTNWGRVIRGLKPDPYPVFDQSKLAPRDPPRIEFSHELEFAKFSQAPKMVDLESIENVMIYYSDEFIRKLKEKAGKLDGSKCFSRFQCIMAHLWRKISEARGLDENVTSTMIVPVNGRPKLMLPNEFFGNMILCAHATTTVKELQQGGMSYAASVIQEAIAHTSMDYFQSFIDYASLHEGEELVPPILIDNSYNPDLEVSSWLGFDFHKMDIGGGELCAFTQAAEPFEGIITLIPSPSLEKGGVDVHVSLMKEHAEVFKKIAHYV